MSIIFAIAHSARPSSSRAALSPEGYDWAQPKSK